MERILYLREVTDRPERKAVSAALEKKKEKQKKRWLRIGIQVVFFIFAPSLFTSAFSGVKQFFMDVHQGEPLVMNSFLIALIALCVFTMLFGRFFCGYACAFGSLGDFVYFVSERIQKRTGKRLPPLPEKAGRILRYLPFLILLVIVTLCATGLYSTLSGWSPWEAFSLIAAGNFRLGGYTFSIVLFLLIIIGMAMESRFFCRFLCPMGAVFRLLPVFPWALLKRDRDKCIKGCSACSKFCPVSHELSVGLNAGDCIRCGVCTDVCPRSNISIGEIANLPFVGKMLTEERSAKSFVNAVNDTSNFAPPSMREAESGGQPVGKALIANRTIRGSEFWLTLAKAVLLFIVAYAIGAVRFI